MHMEILPKISQKLFDLFSTNIRFDKSYCVLKNQPGRFNSDLDDRYSNLLLNAYINRHAHTEFLKMI